ncbi:MAG TPA: heterodisulfide reductase-related iron-sulfur binding cluster [Pyrinomonadaceae bacterium]|jgi:Fe-S oxidoreductase/nitrate reductase gamma subunit|nr:heterodisulfide reductase-related iron-sulfur binding cluster [Pyrinomonadaceae bacterium]
MNLSDATRQIYWNITHIWVIYALLLPTAAVASYGIYRHLSRWRRGLPVARFDRPWERVRLLLKHAVAQQRTARNLYAGLFHQFISCGFVVLAIATTVVALDADFGTAIMRGRFYLYFQSFTVDLFGALVMLGVAMAAARRYLKRPRKLVYTTEATLILGLIFLMCLQGFLVEGWRIAVTQDAWAAWSPFGNLFARASRFALTDEQMRAAHWAMWWFHLVTAYAFIAWLPFTKMMHVLTAPLNIYTASLEPLGATLKPVDFEKTESFGVNSLKGFTWKDLLDLDACTECGRCTAVCPAHTVGKELSPRDIILGLRDLMHEEARDAFGLDSANGKGAAAATVGADAALTPADHEPTTDVEARAPLAIIGAVPATSPTPLWQCTTCAACMEACPVFIEQLPKIVDMRRYLVMEEADFPDSMQEAVMSLERRGHPFSGTQATRVDWAEGLNVPHARDAKETEVLLWVGCGGALIERNQKVTRATAQLLERAGVRFAILGRDEKCSGDPARRIGNEFLFEQLAKENMGNLNRYNVKKVVTACPHCFNTFKNEYPQFGGRFEVYHHSEYLAKLVAEGRLGPVGASDRKITFHDPCYLGRQNGVYDAPRELVQISARNGPPLEMERSRSKSFCCGGGGGMSFVDEPADKRVNQERAQEAIETGADVLAVGCPFCMTMMEDGINARKGERDVKVLDISELLWEATEKRG